MDAPNGQVSALLPIRITRLGAQSNQKRRDRRAVKGFDQEKGLLIAQQPFAVCSLTKPNLCPQ